ncbi:MAG: S41 family peptidase [Pseudomonadota bacterium]
MVSSVYTDAIRAVCETVSQKIYRAPEGFDSWTAECLNLSGQVSAFKHKSHVIEVLAEKLQELQMSHLGIYVPSETKQLWTGQSKDTGLRGRFVDAQYVIFQVLPGSPAESAGIRAGDSLATINEKSVVSQFQVQKTKGKFVFLRGENPLEASLEPAKVQTDDLPSLTRVGEEVGLLRISSFRKDLFDDEIWRSIGAERLPEFKKLIVDLRENPGGNFVAMLRGLSPFFCHPKSVGYIIKPRVKMPHGAVIKNLPNQSDDMFQVEIFSNYSLVNLETYAGYGCFEGEVVILVDEETASVAEIFAEAMRTRGKTLILGRVTSGDVLLGVWYDLSILGKDHSFSVPEAVYQNPAGDTLESIGVTPDFEVQYQLDEALNGQDSYILRARETLRGRF